MKPQYTSLGAGLFLAAVCAGAATAQTVIIEPEQEMLIRQYIEKQPVASVDLPDVELAVGEALPATVELHAIDVPEVEYRYVAVNGRSVIVEPQTRRIVRVLD